MESTEIMDSLVSPEITKYLITVRLSSNDFLTIYTSWLSDRIEVKTLSNANDYQSSGIILMEDIKNSAKDLEIHFEQFYNECRDALTTVGGLKNFLYSIDNNKFIIQKNDLFKITYLEINIHETTENLKSFFIAESIEIINSMRNNFTKLKRKCVKDNSDYKELEKSYKKFMDEKNCLEKNLLSKFIILLNSKKDKIVQLQSEIDKNKIATTKVNDDNKSQRNDTDEYDTDGNDTDENDDIFSAQTQKITTDSQFKCISLPKRKNIFDNPSSTKVINLPRRNNPSCSKDSPTAIELNENSKDTEIFKNM